MNETTPEVGSLITIGTLSRQSRLSLKALRLYHELGLLNPAIVDGTTGYRYPTDLSVEPDWSKMSA